MHGSHEEAALTESFIKYEPCILDLVKWRFQMFTPCRPMLQSIVVVHCCDLLFRDEPVRPEICMQMR